MLESLRFTDAEKSAFRSIYAPTATDEQFALFIQECERRQLVPGKDVVFQLRTASEWDPELRVKKFVKKVTLITTIGALRLIAERSGRYQGRGPFTFYYDMEGGELKESKIPLGKIPHAVSVEGYRKDWLHPLFATARYEAYVQMQGKDDDRRPTQMWATRGEEQLAKCAEASMLRTVAPEECSGLNIAEEMNDIISREESAPEVAVTPAVIPQPVVAPQVNQSADAHVDLQEAAPAASAVAPGFIMVPAPDMSDLSNSVTAAPIPALVPEPPQERIQTTVFPPVAPPVLLPPVVLPPCAVSAIVTATAPAQEFPAALPAGPQGPNGVADKPATQKEIAEFLARAAKIVRDKLPQAGLKDAEASSTVKNYILKASGKTTFRAIPAAVFNRLLKILEEADPKEAAAIAKERCR